MSMSNDEHSAWWLKGASDGRTGLPPPPSVPSNQEHPYWKGKNGQG